MANIVCFTARSCMYSVADKATGHQCNFCTRDASTQLAVCYLLHCTSQTTHLQHSNSNIEAHSKDRGWFPTVGNVHELIEACLAGLRPLGLPFAADAEGSRG